MVVEVKDHQDMGDGMQCINHPFTKNPGGICAFCLQEKLGKLVTSSSFPLPKHLASSSSSSSSPSFRSDSVGTTTTASASNLSASLSLSVSGARNVANNNNNSNKLPFLLAKKKKKKMLTTASSSTTANIVYKRSQSTRTTKTSYGDSDLSPRKRNGFWSFLHLYSSKHHSSSKKVGNFNQPTSQNETKTELTETETTTTVGSSSSMSKRAVNGVGGSSSNRNGIDVIVEEDGSPNVEVTPSERKVSRSRSVGCGSRSFSGDFFERITNGFGDCTLRRVESQREGNNNKAKVSNSSSSSSSNPSNGVREMVRCGGIFGGFMIMTSSSSSSSSSSWVSSSSAEHHHHHQHHNHNMGHGGGRNRSWGWAFASPMRAFTSSASSGKRGRTISDSTRSKNTNPNLGAIPSLLAVSS